MKRILLLTTCCMAFMNLYAQRATNELPYGLQDTDEDEEFEDHDNQWSSVFSTYPNPVNDILNVSINQQAIQAKYLAKGKTVNNPVCTIRLYNMMGNMVSNTESSDNNVQINVSNLPDGIYFMHFLDGSSNTPEMKKIIIRR